ncbi:MAG: ABC transporter substrate binding protein [Candidatus Binatia bacterium]
MIKKVLCLAPSALLLALGFPVEAQQAGKIPRIGYLNATSASTSPARVEAFRQGLRELGYLEGKNIVIEFRHAEGKLDRLPSLAAELVRLKVDIIVSGGPATTRPAREATSTIPIVMAQDNDAVTYVDKILKGRTPADLPVEQPIKFEFIVNLKAHRIISI